MGGKLQIIESNQRDFVGNTDTGSPAFSKRPHG
jgi:hypothetical protein